MKKGSKAAKAWGAKMRRLRGKTKTVKVRKTKKKRGVLMARRRYSTKRRVSRRSSSMGGGKLMRGFLPVKGILGLALAGIAAKTVNDAVAPQIIPYQDKVAAFTVGGIPAVAGAFALEMFGKKGNVSNSITFY